MYETLVFLLTLAVWVGLIWQIHNDNNKNKKH